MQFHILTLFPEMVMQGLSTSITGRALQQNKIGIEAVNIRDFSVDKHRKVDDYTYGGGAGMLMQAQPVYDACRSVFAKIPDSAARRVIYVTPQGRTFTQHMAEEFAACDDLVFLCGHYEGVDERVLEEVVTDYVSIGDYVLTGGELAAMVMVDAIARLVPGVLHNGESAETESFHGNLLEYPQYSRPEVWHGKEVPGVLLSGDARKIRQWRCEQAEARTRERRPDLYGRYTALQECRNRMMKQKLLHMDMIELINRGKAELVREEHGHILLRDTASGIYFHTSQEGWDSDAFWRELPDAVKSDIGIVTLHQESEQASVTTHLAMEHIMTCYQYVCTRREKLPVSGLYRPDGQENEYGLVIRPATQECCEAIDSRYSLSHGPHYIRDRIEKGCVFVALVHGELAGFAGLHEEGSLGMLEVLPQYRRQHIGKALATCIINWSLERGDTPYSQAEEHNSASLALQDQLGICRAKGLLYWMRKSGS
jgi:tRNA (guanine37-N1)-methyltransferase